MRAPLGVLLGLIARLWLASLRVHVHVDPALRLTRDPDPDPDPDPHPLDPSSSPWVLAFFHGTQFPLLAWPRRRRTAVMVSLSRDGAMQARAMTLLGMHVVRGSSSRGGAEGLGALVRAMRRQGFDAAFAVDGPRGPYGVAKRGALTAARLARGVLVPMGSAMARGKVLARAWDRFALPWPFSRVAVVLGAPLLPSASPEELAGAVAAANAQAAAILRGKPAQIEGNLHALNGEG